MCLFVAAGWGLRPASAQLSTEDHVAEPGFWPTQAQPSLSDFAGKEACARCHGGIAATARVSSMGRTAMHAASAEVLQQHPAMSFTFGQIHYGIQTRQEHGSWISTYTVGENQDTAQNQLLWIFGTGRVGQSYLYQTQGGDYFEARATFFQSLKNIDFTPARALAENPKDLEVAMGRKMQTAELIRCFSCHATAVNIANTFNDHGLMPGVTCEACHGPGANHVRLMQADTGAASKTETTGIFDPSHLSPTESVEFCGSCHGSWWDVKLAHVTGPSTVRSAPYRLVTSKCWGKDGDPRLVCTACHNPHRELVTDLTAYDPACLQCHSGSSPQVHKVSTAGAAPPSGAPKCPVATSKCASCHMPKVYVPEMKNTFTDHRIRVVREGEAFQD